MYVIKPKTLSDAKTNLPIIPLIGTLILCLIVSLLVSLLGSWAWLIPFGITGALAGFVCFFIRPQWGISLLLLEMIWGGNGRWLELISGGITPRYLIIIACVLGYLVRLIVMRRHLSLPRFSMLLVMFYGVVFLGVAIGIFNSNPSFLQDMQVWLYLFLAIIIVDLWNQQGPPYDLLRLILLSSAGIASIQLVLTLLVNIMPDLVRPLYPFLEKMRILVTLLPGTSIWYVFMGNSLLYGYSIALSVLLATGKQIGKPVLSTHILWLIASLVFLAALLSMTRGTWGQIFITLILVGVDLLVRKRLRLKTIFVAGILLFIPIIMVLSITEWRDAAIARFETLLPWNADSLDPNDSVIVKQIEAQKIVTAIGQSSLFGYGFGYVQVDNELGSIYFHNSYLHFTLKTGLTGLIVLIILFLYVVVNAWGLGQEIRYRFTENRNILLGMVYGFLGVLVATSSNPHMTTPIFVTMLAFMLAFIELTHRQWRRSRWVNGGKSF